MKVPLHAQKHAVRLVKEALDIAGVQPSDIACIAYTKVLPAPAIDPAPSLGSMQLTLLSSHGCHREPPPASAHISGAPLALSCTACFPFSPVIHPYAGPRHGRTTGELRCCGAHAGAAVEGAHRGGEPLCGSHRDGADRHRSPRPCCPVCQRRQHTGM